MPLVKYDLLMAILALFYLRLDQSIVSETCIALMLALWGIDVCQESALICPVEISCWEQ